MTKNQLNLLKVAKQYSKEIAINLIHDFWGMTKNRNYIPFHNLYLIMNKLVKVHILVHVCFN